MRYLARLGLAAGALVFVALILVVARPFQGTAVQEVEHAKLEAEALRQRADTLENTNKQLLASEAELRASLDKAEQKISSLKAEDRSRRSSDSQVNAKDEEPLKKLKQQLKHARQNATQLATEMDTYRMELELSEFKLNHTLQKLNRTESKMATMKKFIASRQSSNDHEAHKALMEQQLDEQKKKHDKLILEKLTLQDTLDAALDEVEKLVKLLEACSAEPSNGDKANGPARDVGMHLNEGHQDRRGFVDVEDVASDDVQLDSNRAASETELSARRAVHQEDAVEIAEEREKKGQDEVADNPGRSDDAAASDDKMDFMPGVAQDGGDSAGAGAKVMEEHDLENDRQNVHPAEPMKPEFDLDADNAAIKADAQEHDEGEQNDDEEEYAEDGEEEDYGDEEEEEEEEEEGDYDDDTRQDAGADDADAPVDNNAGI